MYVPVVQSVDETDRTEVINLLLAIRESPYRTLTR